MTLGMTASTVHSHSWSPCFGQIAEFPVHGTEPMTDDPLQILATSVDGQRDLA